MKINQLAVVWILAIFILVSCNPVETKSEKSESGSTDRTVLPLKEPTPQLYTELDVRDATAPAHFEVKAPKGAPNVVLVLIDDLGFAGTSKFGGPVSTPTFDKMASQGVY